MLEFIFNTDLHDVDLLSILLRLSLATLFGGIIGMNRTIKGHSAGFRTHILVCIGAALVMMTNQYMVDCLGYGTDPARLGAQVITGVGFLGAGAILMRHGEDHVSGLTTAAGIWACACLGLALGIGFYSGAIIGGLLVFLSLSVFQKIGVAVSRHINREAAIEYEEEHETAFQEEEK